MESFATGLKRIKDVCDKAGCKVEFEALDDGFVVKFYRRDKDIMGVDHQENHQEIVLTDFEKKILTFCMQPKSKKQIAEYMGYKDSRSFADRYIRINEDL